MADKKPIRVLLADDHTLFRRGLAEMLATDEEIAVVGEAENGAEAVSRVEMEKPDVVILDVEMPVMGAEEAIGHLLELSPQPKVIIVTMFDNLRLMRKFTRLGADAYLSKSVSLPELLAAVHAVARGRREGDRPLPQEVLYRIERRGETPLSERELEVLLQAARGSSNNQAARTLHLSEATVKRHLANIYAKLGVGSRGEATRRALYEGWISAHEVVRGAPN